MINTDSMRKVLWVGVLFNAAAAIMLSFPGTLGALAGLPTAGSVFYPWLLALFVALFGCTYGWLALQPTINRPLVTLAAVGKTGVFVVSLACLLRGDIQFRVFLLSVGDLAFATVFFLWLKATMMYKSGG